MQHYAATFTLKEDKRLEANDLVWFAVVHQERKEKQGREKGMPKAGHHTHIHILVSGKDRTGAHRLNPRGGRSRFYIPDWQVENGKSFQQMFGYEKPTVSEKLTQGMPLEQQQRHQQRIQDKVAYLNEYFTGHWKINTDKVLAIGKEQQYGKGFFFNLHKLTKQYQEGKSVNNPYHMLETGKRKSVSRNTCSSRQPAPARRWGKRYKKMNLTNERNNRKNSWIASRWRDDATPHRYRSTTHFFDDSAFTAFCRVLLAGISRRGLAHESPSYCATRRAATVTNGGGIANYDAAYLRWLDLDDGPNGCRYCYIYFLSKTNKYY